jgi:hypothetical protein
MTPRTQATTKISAASQAADRLPIFSALYVLGFNYAEVGRLLGVSTMSVHQWAVGKKKIPIVRHLALLFTVTRLTGLVGAKYPPQSRYARRAAIARDAAIAWANLARDEMEEDTAGVYRAEDLERGVALGERMLAKLEAQ